MNKKTKFLTSEEWTTAVIFSFIAGVILFSFLYLYFEESNIYKELSDREINLIEYSHIKSLDEEKKYIKEAMFDGKITYIEYREIITKLKEDSLKNIKEDILK